MSTRATHGTPVLSSAMRHNPEAMWNEPCTEAEARLAKTIDGMDADLSTLRALVAEKETVLTKAKDELFFLRGRRAPVTRVPDDVLTLIFEAGAGDTHLGHMLKRKDGQARELPWALTLAHVCRQWRNAANHTAGLWASIVISDHRSLSYASKLVRKIAVNFGIKIELNCTRATRYRGPLLKGVAALIHGNATRLVGLTLAMCDHANALLLATPGFTLPRLRKLSLLSRPCDPELAPPTWPGSSCGDPSELREISLQVPVLPVMTQTRPCIQRLSLCFGSRPQPTSIVSFLHALPNLQNLTLSTWSHRTQPSIWSDGPAKLAHLKQLTLHSCELPNLEATSLTGLTMQSVDVKGLSFERFLSQNPNIRRLSTSGSSVVYTLLKEVNLVDPPAVSVSLPHLEELAVTLSLDYRKPELEGQMRSTGHSLQAMLTGRRTAGYGLHRLRFAPMSEFWQDRRQQCAEHIVNVQYL